MNRMGANSRNFLKAIARPLRRKSWAKIKSRVAQTEDRLSALDQAWRTHVPAFLNAVSSVGAFGYKLASQARDLDDARKQISTHAEELTTFKRQLGQLWTRIDYVRQEFGLQDTDSGTLASPTYFSTLPEPRIISLDKVEAAVKTGDVRLNLGCGRSVLPGYINVNRRELPGVDVVASIDNLPFESGTVREIFSEHLVEQFTQEALRQGLLPYWRSLLMKEGMLRAITSDAAAMIEAASTGSYSFEDFREVLFGPGDAAGGFHRNFLTPESMRKLLEEAKLAQIEVPFRARRNGKCYEFEIIGQRLQ